MKKFSFFIAFMAVIMMMSSCSYRTLDFTIVSTKTYSLPINKSAGTNTEGKCMRFLGMGASIKDAIDNALTNAGPGYDLLVDGVIYTKDNFFVSGYKVVGIAVKSADMRAELGEDGFKEWCSNHNVNLVDENGNEVALQN